MTTIRILHASDFHICKYLNVRQMSKRALGNISDTLRNFTFAPSYCPYKLARFVRFVRRVKDSVDAIIITGDIATTGRRFDLEEALNAVHEITAASVPVYLLPGNHDRWTPHRKGHYSAIRSLGYDPGGKDFHEVFGEFWEKDVRSFRKAKDGFAVRIVAADFSLRQPDDCQFVDDISKRINQHGQGKVHSDILQEMVNATSDLQSFDTENVVTIWAVHFPPMFPNIDSHLKLLGEDLLVERARELGVLAIVAGHTHEALPYPSPDRSFYVLCAGTLTEYSPSKNQFYIVSLEDSGNGCQVGLENYELDSKTDEFVRRPLKLTPH
jgi:3',5'-cyclic AMP phosphodiesterase CpdA